VSPSPVYRLRFRNAIAALGATIVLSTFVLGIHWIAGMVAGLAVAILSVAIAQRIDRRLERSELAATYSHMPATEGLSAPTADS
jgi:membrane-associated phospholipid phosphatase